MAATDQVQCFICGASNDAHLARCGSCGASLDAGMAELSGAIEAPTGGLYQETFSWRAVVVSAVALLVLVTFVLALLPAVVAGFDPQGFYGVLIAAAIYFLVALIVANRSSVATLVEPAVAALAVVVPTLFYLSYISDVHHISMLTHFFGGALMVLVALFGAIIGEKAQLRRATA